MAGGKARSKSRGGGVPAGPTSEDEETNEPTDVGQLREENRKLRRENNSLKVKVREMDFSMKAMSRHYTKDWANSKSSKLPEREEKAMVQSEEQCAATVEVLASWIHNKVWPEKKFLSQTWALWNLKKGTMCYKSMKKIQHCIPEKWSPDYFWLMKCVPRIKKLYKEKRANTNAKIKQIYIGKIYG